jgi:hypothetical protein
LFDWSPSLLGNRSRNSSMDTLTTQVLWRYMVTNGRRANVFIDAAEGKTIHRVEEMCLLGRYAVWFLEEQMFRSNLAPPSSG